MTSLLSRVRQLANDTALPPHLLQVARTLGANPWRLFWRVTWPLLQPALRRGMAFAAATAIGEFAVTLFLSRPEWATLTTLVYETLGRPGPANRDAALVLADVIIGAFVGPGDVVDFLFRSHAWFAGMTPLRATAGWDSCFNIMRCSAICRFSKTSPSVFEYGRARCGPRRAQSASG